MRKITMLVAQHKIAEVYCNEIYRAIHVGKAHSKIELEAIGDNTGNNISDLNPYYCELTALYWGWKNLHDSEYIGLCHYRRYFKKEFSSHNVDTIMKNCDIVLSRRIVMSIPILSFWYNSLVPEDIDAFWLYMLKHEKNDKKKFMDFFLGRNYINPGNMFVCKKVFLP